MKSTTAPEDPEPEERRPAGALFVPVRPGPAGQALRVCRTPLGTRTAVAFTSARRLAVAFGPGQPWIRLAEPALRALAEPLGVRELTVDPRFSARRGQAPAAHPVRWEPAAVGVLRVTGAAAGLTALTSFLG
ncbi:SAV_915 family protein [Streptomyces sp. NPDC020096]